VRRASFEGNRAEAHTIAANIDTVVLVHSLTSPPNQRRLERELVLAFDSGATPVVVLTKSDLVDDPARHRGRRSRPSRSASP
jgi:ribosome biogenesis GTPase